MDFRKITSRVVRGVKLSLKIAWRIFWLYVGIRSIVALYSAFQGYLNGTYLIAGTPAALNGLLAPALLVIPFASYALYYGISGKLLWKGIFPLSIFAVGIGALIFAGHVIYTTDEINDLPMAYISCFFAFICIGYSLSKFLDSRYESKIGISAVIILTLLGMGLTSYALVITSIGTKTPLDTKNSVEVILTLTFLTMMALNFLLGGLAERSERAELSYQLKVPDGFLAGDSVYLGSWCACLGALAQENRTACLSRMSDETRLSTDKLQWLCTHAGQPAVITSLSEEFAEVCIEALPADKTTAPAAGEPRNIVSFTLSREALYLLFQHLPLFVITADKISIHRSTEAAFLTARNANTENSQNSIFDALGYEYHFPADSGVSLLPPDPSVTVQPRSKFPSAQKCFPLVPVSPVKAAELQQALLAYLTRRQINLPAQPDLSTLISMMICRFGYSRW